MKCVELLAGAATLMCVAVAQPPVDAKKAFEGRQRDLVSLSGYLGTLHRLRQLCDDKYAPNHFRNRMREIVPLESPMGSTRLDMITAFNAGFRDVSSVYDSCDAEAKDAYSKTAEQALEVTERLYAPFR